MMHRALIAAAIGLAAALTAPAPALAQDDWPNKAVRFLVPFPVGGTSDVMARMVGDALSKEFGKPFIIENVGGAGGTIGSARAAKLPADGYHLFLSGVGSNAVAHGLDPKLSYDSMRDFDHIAQIHTGPNVLVVHPDQPFQTFAALLDHARKNPGKLTYGYTHAASGHMAMELLKQVGGRCAAGGKPPCAPLYMVGVGYRGGGPLLSDLLGNQIPMIFINQDAALPHVRAGKLRALAVTSATRNPLYPDVPTIAEAGLPGYVAISWSGLSAPKGTPPAVLSRLEAAMAKIMGSPEIRQRMESVGFVIPPQGAKAYTDFVRSEIDLWSKVIRNAGIKAE